MAIKIKFNSEKRLRFRVNIILTMNATEKREAAFQRMTAEQRKVAEAKQKLRAEKKAKAAAEAAKKAAAQYEPSETERLLAKKKFLKELALYFKAVQLNKAEYKPAILEGMKKELTVDDFPQLREEYVDVIRTAFFFRTPVYTHPVKTEAANFLDKVMNRYQEAEWGLILGMLTEGYVSKTLAGILVKHSELIIQTGLGCFVARFIADIKGRNGNLEEDGSVSPFTPTQKKRIEELYAIYCEVEK